MRSMRLSLLALGLSLAGSGPLVSACATLGTPKACRTVCDEATGETCQQCLVEEKERRAEARRKREEERRQAPPPSYPSGGGGGVSGPY